jgi:hypothetical protein
MSRPVLKVGISSEHHPDAFAAEANAELAAVPRPMLLQPLLKPRVVLADSFQLKGTGNVLLFDTFNRSETLFHITDAGSDDGYQRPGHSKCLRV